jgi:hypothetical protein
MEKLDKNQKIALGLGAAALVVGGAYYYFKNAGYGPHEDLDFGVNVVLSKEQAIARKKLVSDVHYNHSLVLLKGKHWF